MPFQPLSRAASVLASVLGAGLMLTMAGCSHLTPLGPDPSATVPQPHHLQSPLVLQALRPLQQLTSAGGCPAGSFALSGSAGPCYGKTGTSVTITSAGLSQLVSFRPPSPPGQGAQPVQYGFWITVPAADVPALEAVITKVAGPPSSPGQGPVSSVAQFALVISVGGRSWLMAGFSTQFTSREFEALLRTKNQALQLQGLLAPSG
jgi:hypothetical protein